MNRSCRWLSPGGCTIHSPAIYLLLLPRLWRERPKVFRIRPRDSQWPLSGTDQRSLLEDNIQGNCTISEAVTPIQSTLLCKQLHRENLHLEPILDSGGFDLIVT